VKDPIADIMTITYEVAGITLGENKRSMIVGRLGKRLRQLGCEVEAYVERVRRDPAELTAMLDLLTTNHTAWRREPEHFLDLEQRVIPAARKLQAGVARPRLRIWCAAAATGEEPWTIALSLVRALPDLAQWDAAVLATDISTRALTVARAGRYGGERITALSAPDRALALEPAGAENVYSVRTQLRALVSFARLNLMETWPIHGPFDCIFCRNVMIYFDTPTQERLVNRMARLLAPGGTLYVGHSESLNAIQHPLSPQGSATYVAA
jgi:chemotaxis protein methyltransferase CheR